jgi:hypothetical protein
MRKLNDNKALSEVIGSLIIITISFVLMSGMLGISQILVDNMKEQAKASFENDNHKPYILNIYPFNGAIGLSFRPFVHATFIDTDNDLMSVTFIFYGQISSIDSSNIASIERTFHNIKSGETLSLEYIPVVICGNTYYWSITVNDGIDTTSSDMLQFTLSSICTP